MSITIGSKQVIDKPDWRPMSPQYPYSATPYLSYPNTVALVSIGDNRGDITRDPNIYYFYSTSYAFKINPITDGAGMINNQLAAILGGTCTGFTTFHAGQSPSGTLAAGATTTTVVLSTALPAAVGINQLADRGDGRGYYIRIIGNSAGGSGKTETRYVIGNTAGTQPTLTLDSALSFTPASGDAYEFLSGSIYYCAGTTANYFKKYDILTNSWSAALSTTGLTAGNYGHAVALCENNVPYNKANGEGYLGTLTATATGATSLTGQAAAGDAAVLANEYRNFQIRIVEDTGTPTAVGQRRKITSHTAGASPVYTVAAWSVEPSETAKYVIENDNDKILFWSSSNTNTYTYNITANTWDTTTYAARGSVNGVNAFAVHGFSYVDATKNARNSNIYLYRGIVNNNDNMDLLDIAAGTNGVWTNDINYGGKSRGAGNAATKYGVTSIHNSANQYGKYFYMLGYGSTSGADGSGYRFDMLNHNLIPYNNALICATQSNSGTTNHGGIAVCFDGSDKYVELIAAKHNEWFYSCALFDNI